MSNRSSGWKLGMVQHQGSQICGWLKGIPKLSSVPSWVKKLERCWKMLGLLVTCDIYIKSTE